MKTIVVLENKVSAIQGYLKILERYKGYTLEEIKSNVDIRGALERYLYLAVQATIDLAEAVIVFKNYRKPTTFRDSFYILEEQGIIDLPLSEKLALMVGFRNILAHDYERIDYSVVYDVLHSGVKDIEEFSAIIAKSY